MVYFDFLFFAATLTLGWGLSLATYRLFALRSEWPMGELHRDKPFVPILLGVFAVVIALLFAAARGGDSGGWWIVLAGLVWAVFWTGFMRVGSQVSLLLAPAATLLLCAAWISVRVPPELGIGTSYAPTSAVGQVRLPVAPDSGARPDFFDGRRVSR
ncbi:MAG: hypothetical protein KDJ36_07850 [Hyphomicrobiaceae bacterium]|nr:hypothetical protein [Hyphomicrobiaceae bacterium]